MSQPEEKSGLRTGALLLVLVCLIGFLAWVAKPNFIGSNRGPVYYCINNLRQLDGAILEWTLEKGITNGTVITWNDIKPYYEPSKPDSDKRLPKCPSGGKYIFLKVGTYPQVICSLDTNVFPAHRLP